VVSAALYTYIEVLVFDNGEKVRKTGKLAEFCIRD